MPIYKNVDLDTTKVKNRILTYLHNSDIDLKSRHEYITNEKDMDNIRDNDYIICPRISGTRTWIIFFKEGDNYYAVNFPKHSQMKRDKIIIHPIEITAEKNFYNGTIMEGIFFRFEDRKFLVIDEVYCLCGESQLLKPKDDRLNMLSRQLMTDTTFDPKYSMTVTPFYSIDETSILELYDKIKFDHKIQDIIFYPRIYGRKIYTYTIIEEDLIDDIIKFGQFNLQKTPVPDVYNILDIDSGEKKGIAYIPDMATSRKCKQWFKSNKKKELLPVKFRMDTNKNKWIPLEVIEEDLSDVDSDTD